MMQDEVERPRDRRGESQDVVGKQPAVPRGNANGAVPLFPEIGIVALVPDHWKREWQPRHQIMSRLARYFHVVWVNPAPHWRDIRRARTPTPSPSPGLEVYDADLWLPRVHRPPALAAMLLRARVQRARQLLRARGVRQFVLYIWRPEFAAAVGSPGFNITVYHIDDEYTFNDADEPIRASERHLLLNADQVFIHSRALMMKKGHLNARTLRVPNGVDLQAFGGPGPLPDDLAQVPHPRIGYAGYIKDQLDWRLITALATARPDWSLVFVGMNKVRDPENRALVDALATRSNVFLLGDKTSEELALYPRHFDVCVMPYVCDGYTRYIYPLKLNEYLATGRPVVGTPIDALQEYRDLVELAATPDEWVAAIQRVLGDEPKARSDARIAMAAKHDWQILTRRIAESLASKLGVRLASPEAAKPSPSETAA